MKRILIAGGLALAAAGQAFAADLPQAPPPPPRAPATYVPVAAPIYNWGGVYLGINGGWGWGNDAATGTLTGPPLTTVSGSISTSGWLLGGTLGANYQVGAFVAGVEGDIDYTHITGSLSPLACTTLVGATGVGACSYQNNWLGTFRGRAGFAADRVLFYATGGGAYGNLSTGFNGTTTTTNKFGWAAGGGVEVAFAPNWTVRAEYLYVDLSNTPWNCGSVCAVNVSFTESLVRAGVNFKFGP